MRPDVGGMKPVTMRMVVDLPAPFGPRKPSTSPRSTLNEMPSTARFAPKALTRFSILIISKGRDYRRNGGLKSPAFLRRGLNEIRPCRVFRARRNLCRRGFRAGISREAGPYYRAVRPRRRLRFHRPLRG